MTDNKYLASMANSIGQIHCKILDLARIFDNYNKEFRLIRDDLENIEEDFNQLVTFENGGINLHRISYYKLIPGDELLQNKLYISLGADSLEFEGKEANELYQYLKNLSLKR
jgi:hypothetical protein